MKELIIKPAKKYKFIVEVELSEVQLKVISERNGWGHEMVEDLKNLQKKESPITINPNYSLGFGSDINDFITSGFLLESKMDDSIKTPLSHDDLHYCGYRCKVYDLVKVEFEDRDCKVVKQNFNPCYSAFDKEGNLLTINPENKTITVTPTKS